MKIKKKKNVFLVLVFGEFFLIMLGNKMGFVFIKIIFFVLFIECMNFLECI